MDSTIEYPAQALEEVFNELASQIEEGIKKQLYGTVSTKEQQLLRDDGLDPASLVESCSSVGH